MNNNEKFDWIFLPLILMLIFLSISSIVSAQNRPSTEVAQVVEIQNWTLVFNWTINEDGELIGGDSGNAIYEGSYGEMPVVYKFKLKSLQGRLIAGINANISNILGIPLSGPAYLIQFINNGNSSLSTILVRNVGENVPTSSYIYGQRFESINGQRMVYDSTREYQVEILSEAGHIQIYIYKQGQESVAMLPVIDYYDPTPLPPGKFAFSTIENSSARLSNIELVFPSPNLGEGYGERPTEGDLINTAWGEVPANHVMVVVDHNLKYHDANLVAQQLASNLSGRVVGAIQYINLFQIKTKSKNESDLIRDLDFAKRYPSIVLAFPHEQLYRESQSPLDGNDCYKDDRGKGYRIIGIEDAWKEMEKTPLSNVTVGVADDGLYKGYGQFEGDVSINTIDKINNIPCKSILEAPLPKYKIAGSHGTGVMNILAANPDNRGQGLVGLASQPLHKKLNVTMCNIFPDNRSFIIDILGLKAEIESGCTILSCSWGDNNAHEDATAMYYEFFYNLSRDYPCLLFICSAGNNDSNDIKLKDGKNRIPNGKPEKESFFLPNIITVGNIMNDKEICESSNLPVRNYEIPLFAPGQEAVWGRNKSGDIIYSGGGTSMAAPQVTAAAALIRSIDPCLTAKEIKEILISEGMQIDDPNPNLNGDEKILSIYQSVKSVIDDLSPHPAKCKDCTYKKVTILIPKKKVDGKVGKETDPQTQGLPKVESFSFTPNPVCLGEDTNLTWTTSNATGATIKPNVGEVEASGYRILTPEQSMTYSIWAWNDLGNSEVKRVLLIVEGCMEEGTTSQPPGANIIYDFMEEAYDEGQWQAGPPNVIFRLGERSESDSRGAALWKYDCLLSDRSIPGRVLQASPPQNGYVAGIYRHMNYLVDSSDHLTGRIGFIDGSKGGNVTFRISIIQGNLERNLMLRPLAYKDGMVPFDIPLEEYAGWQPAFSFRVEANGPSTQNNAVWQDVEIRGSSQRTVLRETTTSGSNFASDFTSNIFNTDNNDLGTPGSIEDWLNRP